jgi:hypothetical protein
MKPEASRSHESWRRKGSSSSTSSTTVTGGLDGYNASTRPEVNADLQGVHAGPPEGALQKSETRRGVLETSTRGRLSVRLHRSASHAKWARRRGPWRAARAAGLPKADGETFGRQRFATHSRARVLSALATATA